MRGYTYAEYKPNVLTDDGQRLFLQIRDRVKSLLKIAGAFRLQEAVSESVGSSFDMLACVDRLVELGEIYELPRHESVCPWSQNRVFTDGGYRP